MQPNLAFCAVNIPWKSFVSENKEKVTDHEEETLGHTIKDFYLDVISSPSTKTKIQLIKNTNSKRKTRPSTTNPSKRDISKFLLAAQNNDVETLCEMHSLYPNIINCTDEFGWTGLMCATQSKALQCVKYLVQCNADKTLSDNRGRTVFSLAKSEDILKLLNESNRGQSLVTYEHYESIYCDSCKEYIKSNEQTKHLTSTVHIFNSKNGKFPTYYGIPDTNKGFQLLLKKGWNKEEGLGPNGCGNKFPIKTVHKIDRRGLGAKRNIPRVTHFTANDTDAISNRINLKHSSIKRQINSKYRREKSKEIMLRNELS